MQGRGDGSWVEDTWSFGASSGSGAGRGGAARRDAGSREGLKLRADAQQQQHLSSEDPLEDDPWGEFLTMAPPATSGAQTGRETRQEASSAPSSTGAPGSGWSSLVQLGQQLVRHHEEQGKVAVQGLFRGLGSLPSLPFVKETSASEEGRGGGGAAKGDGARLMEPLLKGAAAESHEQPAEAAAVDSAASASAHAATPQRTSSAGTQSAWFSWLPGSSHSERPGAAQPSRRSSVVGREWGSASAASPLVLPLQASSVQGMQSLDEDGRGGPGQPSADVEEDEDAVVKEEMLRIGRPLRAPWRTAGDLAHTHHTCWHKAMEVLPVLFVVSLLALGTVLYFAIVDRVLAQFKSPFSLTCHVEVGSWKKRAAPAFDLPSYSKRPAKKRRGAAHVSAPEVALPFYPPSCPYIRDEFNCAKYGLPPQPDELWAPDSCQLPVVRPLTLLELLANLSVAFVGDMTVANQYDSFLCQLAQQELPIQLGSGQGAGSGGRQPRGLKESHPDVKGLVDVLAQGQSRQERKQTQRPRPSGADLWGLWPFSDQASGAAGATAEAEGGTAADSAVVSDVATAEAAALGPRLKGADGMSGQKKMAVLFPRHNVTVAFYHSPFLVKASVTTNVNSSACREQKAALQNLPVPSAQPEAKGAGGPNANVTAQADAKSSFELRRKAARDAVRLACYPNLIDLAEPDPFWAGDAGQYELLVMSSGRGWTEEAVERSGLGIAEGSRREEGLSLEGLQGQWAFPRAMAAVASWLDNTTNFAGTAVFRSFSPSHVRKQCASRQRLSIDTQAFEANYRDNFARYNDALADAVGRTRHFFLNITALSWERADGHPWMCSPARPKADCGNWCLPGVPDAWNHVLGNMIMQIMHKTVRL